MPRNRMSIDAEQITQKKDKTRTHTPLSQPHSETENRKMSNEYPYVPHVYVKKRATEY